MNLIIKDTDRVLVVAPHPDDESIGCGGLLAMYGNQCDILLLTDGRKGYDSSDDVNENELVEIREKELLSAAEIANVRKVYTLRIPDGTASVNSEKIKAYDITPYDIIFVPNRQERHKDHCVVACIFDEMRKRQKPATQIYEYEVWSPLNAPTHSLNITDIINVKEKMVAQYKSQIKYVDYVGMALSLSKYRGAGIKVEYAEAFLYVPNQSLLKKLYHKLPHGFRQLIRKFI